MSGQPTPLAEAAYALCQFSNGREFCTCAKDHVQPCPGIERQVQLLSHYILNNEELKRAEKRAANKRKKQTLATGIEDTRSA